MPVNLSGNWGLVKAEGLEDYLRSIKAPEEKIAEAGSKKPSLVIKQTGDNQFETTFASEATHKYTIGTPFDTKIFGKDLKTVASWEGNKLVLKTTNPENPGKEHVTTREIVGGNLVQKASVTGGPVGTATFAK